MLRRVANFVFWGIFLFFFASIIGSGWYIIHERSEAVAMTLLTPALDGPRDPIVIHFSQPMRPESFEGKITLKPAMTFESEWNVWRTELRLQPLEQWQPDASLQLFLGQGRTRFFARTRIESFEVATLVSPRITRIVPEPGAKDVSLGVEDPIRIELDRSARHFFVDFRIEPPVEVTYRTNEDKTVFEILPQASLESNRSYALQAFIKWRDAADATYRFLGETHFTTLPPAPASWSRDLAVRVDEAKRFTRPRRENGKYIDINLASQIMTLFENGRAVDAYVVSSGKRGMETPRGEFAIANKANRPWSKRYNLFMPYWQSITPDGLFGIHELPEWPGGYKEGANHLGTPVSHGCVRLGVGPARRVYEWTDIGTPVVVY